MNRRASMLLLVGILGCTPQNDGGPTPPGGMEACRVVRIVDGDTLHCEPVGRIRLLGIDAPELAQSPFGRASTEALAGMIPEGTEVRLEADVELRDRYGRALRYIWVDDVMVNWAMVREGYAVLLTYPPNVRHVEDFQAAQEAAREQRSGLWSTGGFECIPRDFRRDACR